ncbi:AAA domain-containing protein [Obelidium mucronatum]|nr:AAA domain-containing protein [Obelidium mucronatum]
MKRIKQIHKHIASESDTEDDQNGISNKNVQGGIHLTIGGVTLLLEKPNRLDLVPTPKDSFLTEAQELILHFRWMMQKDILGQDMFLIGPPGPLKRSLVLKYAQLAQREVEYFVLSKDVTDGDLKQRREIRGSTAFYTDQACVRAAIHGRILILDGIEKAERNVLPIINNLLENREMALDDGRFLVHPKRYDLLLKSKSKEEIEKWKLVRTSERFVVIGLGLPVPKYEGHPLDPPLRSRFQARNINVPTFLTQLSRLVKLAPNVPQTTLERLVSVAMVLRAELSRSETPFIAIPEFPNSLDSIARILNAVRGVNPRAILDGIYPYALMGVLETEQKDLIESVYQRFEFGSEGGLSKRWFDSYFRLGGVRSTGDIQKFLVQLVPSTEGALKGVEQAQLIVKSGGNVSKDSGFYVQTDYHKSLLTSLVLAHFVGDVCVIGEKGVGKSALVRAFVKLLGYRTEYVPLYKDMSARDLLQRRSTNIKGDTIWENSALVKAAIDGSVAILDQIEAASEGVIASIQSLICEREIPLPDGTLLVNSQRYRHMKRYLSDSEMKSRQIIQIHDAFRIVALARPASQSSAKGKWLTPELLNLFSFVPMRSLTFEEEQEVVLSICPVADDSLLTQLLSFAKKLRNQPDESIRSLAAGLSTRQLIRCTRRMKLFPSDSLFEIITKAQLSQFLPSLMKEALERLLNESKIYKPVSSEENITYEIVNESGCEVLRIGNVSHPISTSTNALLIPDVLFYDNPKQTIILREMLKDYILGEHLLLIGNQGVGKNKLVDKLLQLLRLPREYMQLHRDTTIHSLTSTPSIVDGVLVYEDSPLVRAAREGYILVVDEADKAPTHVTYILKSLVEDGEMVLSDGRRLVYTDSQHDGVIPIHKNFRMFVLANRPGFPFLGNDFFGEIGDVFAAHCIGNPGKQSELELLKKYGPSVPEDILEKLVASFCDLRLLVDEGMINYPYSTRELVSIVKHLERYPEEGLSRALGNVFDFDSYETDMKELVITTLSKNGVLIGMQSDFKIELGSVRPLPIPIELESWRKQSSKNSRPVVCIAENVGFQLLGGWPLIFRAPSSDRPIQRIDVRSVSFTEQVYAFKIPCEGEVLDACGHTASGSFYVLASNPIALFLIDSTHRKLQMLDLYEFFPLQKNIPQLNIVEFSAGMLCLHNPDENSLLILNTNERKVYSQQINFMDQKSPSKMLPFAALSGVLLFYQTNSYQIIFIDFSKSIKVSILLPVKPLSIHVADPLKFIWIVQATSLESKLENFVLTRNENNRWVLESLDCGPQSAVMMDGICPTRFDHFDYPNTSRSIIPSTESLKTSFGMFIKGLPEAMMEHREPGTTVYCWPREATTGGGGGGSSANEKKQFGSLRNGHMYLEKTKQIVNVIPMDEGIQEGVMEILDPHTNNIRTLKIPVAIPVSAVVQATGASSLAQQQEQQQQQRQPLQRSRKLVSMIELPNGHLLTVDLTGMARVWQTDSTEIAVEVNEWKRLVGSLETSTLTILYSGGGDGSKDGDMILYPEISEDEKKGKKESSGQGEGNSGSGGGGTGGQGAGGAGGSGGEGEGGSSGSSGGGGGGGSGQPPDEGRTSGTVDMSKFTLRTANDVPKEVTDTQKQLHEMSMKKRLDQLKMTEKDMQQFATYRQNISHEIRELRAVIEATEAKKKERVWLRNQSTGDVDDTKLIEGVTGERAIYKRRGDDESVFLQNPKRMYVSFDLSASMTRFNGLDSRLDRSFECALLIMEAFKSFEHKFQYKLCGHSGDAANIDFIQELKYPKDEKAMFEVLGKMSAHAKFCLSGDNTVSAVETVIADVQKGKDADDYFALILSDANIGQYNINPTELAKALSKSDKVNAYIIFIGSIKDQAETLSKAMPGRAFVCTDTKQLPNILKTIFVNSMLK